MFNGSLNRDAFMTMFCQQSRSGRGVDSRWVQTILSVSKSTAIAQMRALEVEGLVLRTEHAWRSNALKFWYYPSDCIWADYHAKLFRAGYNAYLKSMMEM